MIADRLGSQQPSALQQPRTPLDGMRMCVKLLRVHLVRHYYILLLVVLNDDTNFVLLVVVVPRAAAPPVLRFFIRLPHDDNRW